MPNQQNSGKRQEQSCNTKGMAGMCLNWKVLAGLAVVGVGIWAIAPNLVVGALPLLLFLACPLSMFLMMKGMGRMTGNRTEPPAERQATTSRDPAGRPLPELKARLAGLQEEQEAVAREIGQRTAVGTGPNPESARAGGSTDAGDGSKPDAAPEAIGL